MKYVSTRGRAPAQDSEEVLISGLAPDGGLFLPEAWPQLSRAQIAAFKGKPYAEVARALLGQLLGGLGEETLDSEIAKAYRNFDAPEVAPLRQISEGRFLLELFHGPTLAFKDIALQLLGRLLARALQRRGQRATVLAATSGDTGSAAIAALGGLEGIDLFVLHPQGRVSEVQRRQMTTTRHHNVHNIALEGSFDDAQAIVKALFADREFAAAQNLTAVNSINFVRIAAQAVYYFTATAELGVAPTFVVPTGNFGDVFAAESAMRMGLPVERLVVATNANDILARTFATGTYAAGRAQPTLSPSMDIQVASNFERALFEAMERDAHRCRTAMEQFAQSRSLTLAPEVLERLRARYDAVSVSDAKTLAAIARHYERTGQLIDPHTAVALAAADEQVAEGPLVVLATAHPAKFPDAVRKATGQIPPLPERLRALYEGEERQTVMANDLNLVREFIAARTGAV
ncbi:MAG: threonine synthase [Alphaproteobacteria bacterium]|nr:threonine synthase [Alphaproteobacteria bacterium]